MLANRFRMGTLSGVVAAVAVLAGAAFAANEVEKASGEKVEMTTCPAAVQKTITAKAGQSPIVSITKFVEDGKTEYDVMIQRGSRTREFEVAGDGGFQKWIGVFVELKDCPPAVQKKILDLSAGATLEKIEDVVDELIVNIRKETRHRALFITLDGKVRAWEDTVAMSECPPAVQTTITQKATGFTLDGIYKKTEARTVTYIAKVVKGDEDWDFHIAPDGKFLGWEDGKQP
jgi:hypothetical protein